MAKKEYKFGDNRKKNIQAKQNMGPTQMGEKPKDLKKAFKQLASYSKSYFFIVIIAVILAITATIFNLIGPDKLSEITDIITAGMITGIDVSAVKNIAIFLIKLYVLGFVFNLVQGIIMATITQRITKSLRRDISEKINKLPLRYFDNSTYGDILSRITNDVDLIGQTLNESLSSLFASVVMFLGALFMMFKTNWIMAIAGILATIAGFGLMAVIISKSQKYFMMQQKTLGEINGHIEEMYAGHDVVKAYNAEKSEGVEFNQLNEKLYTSAWKSQFMSGLMMPLMGFVGNFGYVVVCIVGAALAMKGSITFGVIVAFMIYIRFFTQPLSQIAQVATSLQSTAAASERVFEFLNEEELKVESEKTQRLEDIKGNVEFKNVQFGYKDKKMIINNFSAEVKASQKIAIVGPTGAGKTTLVNLLMRFYELNGGDITIDGVSTKTLTRENIHTLFSMVLQDTWLFEGTIKENIVYNTKNITDGEVVSACKSIGLHHFIMTLPNGYETVLDEELNLSAGQKQLISIARAMIENSPMLILDEATSSVDTRTEILIQNAMDQLMKGRTSFIIAHRLSTIKNADLILVMNHGDIIEKGTHDELMAQNGFYADLYNSQFAEV